MGAKTAPRTPKLGYFDGRATKLCARVNQGTPCVYIHILYLSSIQTQGKVYTGKLVIFADGGYQSKKLEYIEDYLLSFGTY